MSKNEVWNISVFTKLEKCNEKVEVIELMTTDKECIDKYQEKAIFENGNVLPNNSVKRYNVHFPSKVYPLKEFLYQIKMTMFIVAIHFLFCFYVIF